MRGISVRAGRIEEVMPVEGVQVVDVRVGGVRVAVVRVAGVRVAGVRVGDMNIGLWKKRRPQPAKLGMTMLPPSFKTPGARQTEQ